MQFFLKMLAICIGISSLGYTAYKDDDSSLWLIQEEFIKIGKKEAYETLQNQWMQGFAKKLEGSDGFWRVKKSLWSIYGLQVQQEPQYMYMIPLPDSCSLMDFFNKQKEYNDSLVLGHKPEGLSLISFLNFSVNSLHIYLKHCSHIEVGQGDAWEKTPFITYWVYGITPGNEQVFEEALHKLAGMPVDGGLSGSWRAWRVLIGSDAPKYVIMAFAASDSGLEGARKMLKTLPHAMKDIIRNQKEGRAILKMPISLLP